MAVDRDTTFTWYGHSCLEVKTPGGLVMLIDPWFGNPKSPRSADSVTQCDILLVTHGHFDHMGSALQIAARTQPFWPTMHELSLYAGRRLPGGQEAVVGMNQGGTVEHRGVRMTMVRADHSAGDWSDEADVPLYLGEPVGFVVELENGFRFYFAGDTDLFSDMRLIGELHRPELAFLPIGGHYTMDPRTAAIAVDYLGIPDVVPIHWGTFPALAGTPARLREELEKRNVRATVHEMQPGGTLE